MTRGIDKGERLVAAMIEREDAVAAGKALLRSFSEKAKAVFERFDVVESRAKQVEQVVSDAMAKPNEVISTARSQAAQLERVCGAVRKVFAGLSETTIKANAQTRRFDDESKSALTRLERLKAETDRSSNTLRTWVEEAVRVQSRLAESISAAPPIGATHPPDAIAGLAGVLETTGQTIKTADAPREAVMPPRQSVATHTIGEDPEIVPPRTRADEVSRLIVDAKRA
ncbi:MAG: hypothetical protein IIB61_05010 [Planctomycetes bacterium]|nr:hypothetical protein [Planctomycetota bacterium]